MGRSVRDRKIDSRTARGSLLVRNAPYRCTIGRGRSLGYRKGREGGTWFVHYRSSDGTRNKSSLAQPMIRSILVKPKCRGSTPPNHSFASGKTAVASISIRASGSTSATTWTTAIAG